MIEELRARAGHLLVPEGAQTFQELFAALEGVSEKRAREEINALVEEGKWQRVRKASTYYYWPVEAP
jgi:hypothetical protein